MTMLKVISTTILLGFSSVSFGDEETAKTLATMLRAARSVISDKIKKMQTNPKEAGIDMADAQRAFEKKYVSLTGRTLEINSEATKAMKTAIDIVFDNAFSDRYKDTWATTEHYSNKLLPERFAREVGLKLKEVSGGKYQLRLTAIDDCLVNQENKADTWEATQMISKFNAKSWERGKGFFQDLDRKKEARYIIPEYYDTSCLSCHGGDPGKAIHPKCTYKEAGAFGGAISIVIKK